MYTPSSIGPSPAVVQESSAQHWDGIVLMDTTPLPAGRRPLGDGESTTAQRWLLDRGVCTVGGCHTDQCRGSYRKKEKNTIVYISDIPEFSVYNPRGTIQKINVIK